MKENKPITQADLASQLKNLYEDISDEMNKGFGLVAEGFGTVMHRIEEVRTELKEEIAATKTELKEEIAGSRTELKEEIGGLRGEFYAFRHEMREEIADIKLELKRLSTSSLKRV